MRVLRFLVVAAASFLALPATALAQAAIAGVVKDNTGAVLPGVTVEAASPALIEKVRTVVTDATGQYKIIDLRPGTYSVTFNLTGFSTIKREGIELSGSFTATVNAELLVGSVAETITVTGEAPVVDAQGTARQQVMSSEVLDTIPAGRNQRMYATLIPGMSGSGVDVGGSTELTLGAVAIHGGSANDQRLLFDGLTIRNVAGVGNISNFVPDQANAQEITVTYADQSADTQTGGVTFNYVPHDGGNKFSGSFFGKKVTNGFEANNFTPALKAAGLGVPNSIENLTDINPSIGGPILQDKLWFFSSGRYQVNNSYVAGLWENANAGNPNAWSYVPNYNQQALFRLNGGSVSQRLTWQESTKNKFTAFYEYTTRHYDSVALPDAPESAFNWVFPRLGLGYVGWQSPVNNKLLIEARLDVRPENIRNLLPPPGSPFATLIRVTEQGGLIPGLIYRGAGAPNDTSIGTFREDQYTGKQALINVSYVTGSHAFKAGLSDLWGPEISSSNDIPSELSYQFNNGIPNQILERQTIFSGLTIGVRAELGAYAQDRWTIRRLTMNLGLRFDYQNTGYDDFTQQPSPFSTQALFFPAATWYDFKDLSPRLGAAYDLFGDGKTIAKVSVNRYVQPINPLDGNPPGAQLVERVTRSWKDSAPVGSPNYYTPNCNLQNPLANGDCGTISDLRFGQGIGVNYDPATKGGWFNAPYNWEFSTGVQRQIGPRMGAEFAYYRRWFGNFVVTDNLATSPSDYSPFSITAPLNPLLPGGGGYVVSGLYNLNPSKVGQTNNLVTKANNFGNQIQHWNGFDLNLNARPKPGVLLQGGMSIGRTSTDNCQIVAQINNPSPLYCHVDTPFQPQFKFLGSYTVPKVDLRLAGTLQSVPGPQILANYIASNALVQPSLGRPLSGGAANVTVNLVAPGTMYGERLNQLDLRLSKPINFGSRTKFTVNLDLYNALNASTVLSLSSNYANWQTPQGILPARIFELSARFDF